MSAPTVTYNSEGNILASTSISGGANSAGNIVDFSAAKYGGWLGIKNTGSGTVASTNGLQVQVFPATDSANYATIPMRTFVIPTIASTPARQGIPLGIGKYSVTVTNLDTTNSTTAAITGDPIA